MPCYHPMTAYRVKTGVNENGKWPITFNQREGYLDMPVQLPCGQCVGCRLERSRQWAIRCVFEAKTHSKNCFITLTYDEKNLPKNKSLNKKELQLVIKRIRKKYGKGIKFFACGEYGDNFNRPHYHICLFGMDFNDKTLWNVRQGVKLYRSEALEKIWPYGFSTIGDVTFESAAYVARYCVKKVTGLMSKDHYGDRLPEFNQMSRRPGIGQAWFELYHKDVTSTNKVIIRNNLQVGPPRYYDNLIEKMDIKLAKRLKMERRDSVDKLDNVWERLLVKEEIKNSHKKKLKRSYENGNS